MLSCKRANDWIYIQQTFWNIMIWGKTHGDRISTRYVWSPFSYLSPSGIAHIYLVGLNLDS